MVAPKNKTKVVIPKKKTPKKRGPNKGEGGRPTKCTDEITDEICIRLMEGESLKKICSDDHLPHRITIHQWLLDQEKRNFHNKYEKAVNVRTENMFDDLLDIVDDSTNDYMEKQVQEGTITVLNNENIQRSRARVDLRKWYLSKIMPKKFGDKIQQEITEVAADYTKLTDEELDKEINDRMKNLDRNYSPKKPLKKKKSRIVDKSVLERAKAAIKNK